MNWILKKSDKFDYHTNLRMVITPIKEDIKNFNWLISNLVYTSWKDGKLPINMDEDFFM